MIGHRALEGKRIIESGGFKGGASRLSTRVCNKGEIPRVPMIGANV